MVTPQVVTQILRGRMSPGAALAADASSAVGAEVEISAIEGNDRLTGRFMRRYFGTRVLTRGIVRLLSTEPKTVITGFGRALSCTADAGRYTEVSCSEGFTKGRPTGLEPATSWTTTRCSTD